MDQDDKGKGKGLGGLRKPGQPPRSPQPSSPPPPRAGQPPAKTPPPPRQPAATPPRAGQPPAKPGQPSAKPPAAGGSEASQRLRDALNKAKQPPVQPKPDNVTAAQRLRETLNRSANRPGTPGQKPGAAARKPVPAQRAAQQERQAGRVGRPLPKPATRPMPRAAGVAAGAAVTGAAAAALAPEIISQINSLRSRFTNLESEAQLSNVYASIGELDNRLAEIPLTLDALRARGYVHSAQLEDRLEALDEQWDQVRPRVESTLGDHINRLDSDLDNVGLQMNRINGRNQATLTTAETALNGLQSKISSATSGVSGLYDNLLTSLHGIEAQLSQVEWMLAQFDESAEVDLREAEGPLMAVEAEWQPDGKEGPDGVLYLTDQRLMFEQKEEVTTKKFLGLFKSESEKLQGLKLDIAVSDIESVEDSEEGGFLGMGKKDILEFVFSANATVSRARFHLKGQESRDWAVLVRRVTSGDIDKDRADDYVEELEGAEALAAAFPSECPNCYAPLEAQPRGVTSVQCEFCGAVISPVAE
ncbi:MAG: hypothetical protein IPL78_34135 [Chloroflexi bacterium]|nr:hypothetical protein [Chloroflexota bacterium]